MVLRQAEHSEQCSQGIQSDAAMTGNGDSSLRPPLKHQVLTASIFLPPCCSYIARGTEVGGDISFGHNRAVLSFLDNMKKELVQEKTCESLLQKTGTPNNVLPSTLHYGMLPFRKGLQRQYLL